MTAQRLSLLVLGGVFSILAMLTWQSMPLSAQEAAAIRISAGETLEIITDSLSPNAQFSWILTKERKFQTAQRTRFFQTRLAEQGSYSLDVSIQNLATGESTYRAFSIIVTEQSTQLPPELNADPLQQIRTAVLTTEPSAIQNVVYLQQQGGLLKIDAIKSMGKIDRYAVDLDAGLDSNGDGDPANDMDNEGTLSEKSGSAFYLYALPSAQPRVIKLQTSDLSDTQAAVSQISLSFGTEAPSISSSEDSSSLDQNENSPITMSIKNMTVEFEALLDPNVLDGKQTILEWDFGDRSKSLLDHPIHTYSYPGTYTVSLNIRDIATADVLYAGTTTVNILPGPQVGVSSSFSSSVESSISSSDVSGNQGEGSSGSVFKVMMIVFFLLLIAAALYALLTWLKKRTTMSIQKTLEKVEESIVKKDPKEGLIDASEPIKMKKSEPSQAVLEERKIDISENEKQKQDFRKGERASVPPVNTAGPVPSWLRNPQSDTEKKEGQKSPTAKQETIPKTVENNGKAPLPPVSQNSAPVPAWLKPHPDQEEQKQAVQSSPAPTVEEITKTEKRVESVQKAPALENNLSPVLSRNTVQLPTEKPVLDSSPNNINVSSIQTQKSNMSQGQDLRMPSKDVNETLPTKKQVEQVQPKPISPLEVKEGGLENTDDPTIAIIQADSISK